MKKLSMILVVLLVLGCTNKTNNDLDHHKDVCESQGGKLVWKTTNNEVIDTLNAARGQDFECKIMFNK